MPRACRRIGHYVFKRRSSSSGRDSHFGTSQSTLNTRERASHQALAECSALCVIHISLYDLMFYILIYNELSTYSRILRYSIISYRSFKYLGPSGHLRLYMHAIARLGSEWTFLTLQRSLRHHLLHKAWTADCFRRATPLLTSRTRKYSWRCHHDLSPAPESIHLDRTSCGDCNYCSPNLPFASGRPICKRGGTENPVYKQP